MNYIKGYTFSLKRNFQGIFEMNETKKSLVHLKEKTNTDTEDTLSSVGATQSNTYPRNFGETGKK